MQELTDLENEGYHIGEDGELTHKDDLEKEVKRRERRKKERELEIAKRKETERNIAAQKKRWFCSLFCRRSFGRWWVLEYGRRRHERSKEEKV